MQTLKIGFMAFTEAYWDQSYVGRTYAEARSLLSEIAADSHAQVVGPSAPLEGNDQTRAALEELKNAGGRALVIHCSSFFAGELPLVVGDFLRAHPLPVVLWATKERGTGHMKANSFTALHLFCTMLHRQRIPCKWVYGDAADAANVRTPLAASLRAWSVIHKLRGTRIGNIGGRAPGFYLCNYDEVALRRRFGVEIDFIELNALFKRADKVSQSDVDECFARWSKQLNTRDCNRASLEKGLRIYVAAMQMAKSQQYAALTLRCWPEFLVDYGAAACLPLALLSDSGIITSDEGDIGGLISMLAQYYATKQTQTPTLLDLIGFDSDKNSASLWHCGATPISLKREGSVPVVFDSPILSTEPDGAVGPVLETSFQPGSVTVVRFSGEDCRRYFSFTGEVLPVPTQFHGAYAEVQLATGHSVRDMVNTVLTSGCEYHLSLAYTDHEAALREAAYWLGIQPFQQVSHDHGAGAFSVFSKTINKGMIR